MMGSFDNSYMFFFLPLHPKATTTPSSNTSLLSLSQTQISFNHYHIPPLPHHSNRKIPLPSPWHCTISHSSKDQACIKPHVMLLRFLNKTVSEYPVHLLPCKHCLAILYFGNASSVLGWTNMFSGLIIFYRSCSLLCTEHEICFFNVQK